MLGDELKEVNYSRAENSSASDDLKPSWRATLTPRIFYLKHLFWGRLLKCPGVVKMFTGYYRMSGVEEGDLLRQRSWKEQPEGTLQAPGEPGQGGLP